MELIQHNQGLLGKAGVGLRERELVQRPPLLPGPGSSKQSGTIGQQQEGRQFDGLAIIMVLGCICTTSTHQSSHVILGQICGIFQAKQN